MSNGSPPISARNLTHPTSGKDVILRDVKGAIKSAFVLGLREAFKYSPYEQFRNLKITTEFPIKNVDFPCIVVMLRSLSVKFTGTDRRTRYLDIEIDGRPMKMREERRAFEATIGIYHAAYNTAELGLLSDAILDIFSFDSGKYFSNYVDENVPGIACMVDNLNFSGEAQEVAPEGERYIYSDIISVPVYGEVVMRSFLSEIDKVKIGFSILGSGELVVQDYPEGWDW